MSALTIEVVEGPDAGRQLRLTEPLVIGRAPDAGLVLSDTQVSRHHARVRPEGAAAVVEDLGSSNGTFVNHSELHAPALFEPGDELLTGVTVIQLRSERDVAAQPSAVRPVPPALAAAPRQPSYVVPRAPAEAAARQGPAELNALLDVYTKTRAKTAPLAVFVLVALVVVIYFGTR